MNKLKIKFYKRLNDWWSVCEIFHFLIFFLLQIYNYNLQLIIMLFFIYLKGQ